MVKKRVFPVLFFLEDLGFEPWHLFRNWDKKKLYGRRDNCLLAFLIWRGKGKKKGKERKEDGGDVVDLYSGCLGGGGCGRWLGGGCVWGRLSQSADDDNFGFRRVTLRRNRLW